MKHLLRPLGQHSFHATPFGERYFLQISVVFVAYVVAGKLGQATANIRSSNLGPVWPAYGIALAAILICGYRAWVGVAAGAFLVAFFSPVSHVAALGQAAGATLAATTGAFLLHRIANFRPSLSRLSDAISLIALGGFGSAIVSASIGVSVLYATHVHAYSGLGAAWLIYWLGDATGVLLVTPLALRFSDFSKLRDGDRTTELAILLLLLAAICFFIFGDLPFIPVKLHFMAFAVLPFIMWAAIRFGVGVTAFSILIVAATATVGTALGSGPFTSNTTFVNAVLLDVFFGVLSVSGLSLAAVIAERENAERERQQAVSKQAAMEARLRSDEALREREERLRLAQQAARIGTFDWDIRTGVNTWTPELEAMYGLPPGGFGGTQTAFENLVHPDDRAGVIKLSDAAMKSGQPTKGEWRVVWAEGSVHWIAGRWQVFMDASGEPSKMIGVNIDVTQRKRAEEALRESEDKLRLLLDSTAEGIYGIDLEHRCTFCNPACLRTLGYEHVDEVMGKNTHDLIHHSRADGTVIPVEECPIHRVTRSGEGVHAEDEVFWKANGTSFPVEYWSYPQRRGEEVVGAVVAFSDITERKLAEEKLREYEKAVEGSEEMMAVVDREYRYLIANRKFLSQRNMTKEQVVGHLVPEVLNKGVFEAIVKEKLDECFRGKVVRYEMRYTYPLLGERYLFISNFPIEGVGGVDRVACILQDITERKRAEEALSCMNRRVIEAEERERNRIAKDLHEDIGQHLALLANEIDQLKNDLPNRSVELLDRMDVAWKETLEILTDVKASAHELYSPRLEYLGVAAVLRVFCEEFGERKKVEIDFRSHHLPEFMQPEVSICLFRVVQEALHNGVRHSGVQKFRVHLAADDEIHLTVSDSGAGFDVEAARRGRGLALTRIEQRVRLVNGTFSVDSQPERGTTVYVSVPLRSGSDSLPAAG